MSDNKKYYYMRLKEGFYDTDELKLLEAMPDGYLYSNILLKLYLTSLRNNGKLMFKDRIPYNAQMIATITRHQVGTVEKALGIFQEMGLIEVLDNGAIYMLDIQQFIGKSSTEADRIRKYRNEIETQKVIGVQMYNKSTPKIEIELEKELEIDKEKEYIPTEAGDTLPSKTPEILIREEFEELWSIYPNKQGKAKAYAKYKKYRTSKKEYCTKEEVLKGIENYLRYIEENNISKQYIKHGDTYFNGRCWLDVYEFEEETEYSHEDDSEFEMNFNSDESVKISYEELIAGLGN